MNNKRFTLMGSSIFFSILVVIALVTSAQAQLTRGSIAGTIRDNNGAAISGATIAITNTATNISRTTTSNEDGFYRIAALEPGDYTVVIEKTGFEKIEARNVAVRTTQETTYDPQLKVGAIRDVVVISGAQECL